MKVQETSKYSRFKFRASNRRINRSHLNSLKKSIKAENLLMWNPILVTRDGEVIDGQHRLEAAKVLHVPIFYIEVEGLAGDEIGMINTVRRSWNIRDYIHYHMEEGNENYRWLERMIKGTYILVSPLLELTKKQHVDIKSGKFIMDVSERKIFVKRLNHLEQYIACDDNLKNARAMRAFIRLMKRGEFNHDHMIKKLMECTGKIEIFASNIDMMREIERIYNHRLKKRVRIF